MTAAEYRSPEGVTTVDNLHDLASRGIAHPLATITGTSISAGLTPP